MTYQANMLLIAVLLGLGATAGAATTNDVVARASHLMQAQANAIHMSPWDGFAVRDVIVDRDGAEHVRFNRSYRGLPVIGGDVVVHSKAGGFIGASLTLASSINLSIQPRLSADDALVTAGVQFGTAFEGLPTASLVVYAKPSAPVLAYEVLYRGFRKDKTPTAMRYFIDATSGKLLAHWDTVETGVASTATPAVGIGHSLMSGTVGLGTELNSRSYYDMMDPTRGGNYTTDMGNGFRGNGVLVVDGDNTWGNSTRSDRATVAADAQFGVAQTWDYYLNIHGRKGVANDGIGALARVHYQKNYANAYWSDDCFCMTFGDGDGVTTNPFTALDVTGHEMSHGVTSRTSHLDYVGESGGLNEANSDMMGTMVEFRANNPANPPNYLIGEKLFINNPGTYALRSMFKPSLDGISPDCYPTDPDYLAFFRNGLDVHYVSGVANHFYYLLAEGAVVPASNGFGLTPTDLVCNGNTRLRGVGRSAAEQIWYRAMTVYMTSNTGYADARAATLSAATDLFGATSIQHRTVAAAWNAVGVH